MQQQVWSVPLLATVDALPFFMHDPNLYPHLKWLSNTEPATGDEVFVRLSAFGDDLRIDRHNLCCLPNTFTTTYSEAMACRRLKHRIDPCDRFALPNDLQPRWMFVIKPKRGDLLRRGKVMPAFRKNGGGTEVLFERGTSGFTLVDVTRW